MASIKSKTNFERPFNQEWQRKMDNSGKAINYRIYKTELKYENYLVKLPQTYRSTLCRFRLGCSRLPVEEEDTKMCLEKDTFVLYVKKKN